MTYPAQPSEQTPPFELKGSALTLMVLFLREGDAEIISSHLTRKFSQTPGFFRNAPLVLDLGALHESAEIVDFPKIISTMRSLSFVPVAVRGGSETQQNAAIAAGLGVLPEARAARGDSPASPPISRTTSDSENLQAPLKLITQPVRSGQRIVAGGDLVVLGPVSAGSELVAEGNIHVYGPLRGRALAGARGDTGARIFCLQFAPELVAVAGEYLVNEELEPGDLGRSVQVFLDSDRIKVEPF
jgi:septum site-determining protein MinC